MKTYKVKVNGKLYEVQLEAVSESAESISAPSKTESVPAPAKVSAGASTINAPISGKVLSVKVNVGDAVKKGQVVAIIEAMKLENEIPATSDGTVKQICINAGATVNSGDALIELG